MAHRLSVMLALYLFSHAGHVLAAAGDKQRFALDAGAASSTLYEFGRQCDLQILFDFNLVKGLETQAVHGEYTPADALRQMLRGTNLKFDFVNERTLAITPASAEPPSWARLWKRSRPQQAPASAAASASPALAQVLVSVAAETSTQPLLGAQTLQLTQLDIERSGFATPQDLLRTLPQVFGGGPSEDTVLGREASTNSARGSGVNIRGLDAGATLVLLDGNRVAPSGSQGIFQDIANIPLSIIDHIDLLPDGASASYGADAVGGVANFVTRNGFSGAQTEARLGSVTSGAMKERQLSQLIGHSGDSAAGVLAFEYYQRDALPARDRWQETSDLTAYGGSNFDNLYGSPGTITDGVRYWAIPKGQNGTSLSAAALVPGTSNLYDQDAGADITPAEERWSVFGKENLKLSDALSVQAEGLFAERRIHEVIAASYPLIVSVPESNPFYVNPTGIPGPVTVIGGTSAYFGVPEEKDRVATGNFSLEILTCLPRRWTTTGRVAYAFERQHEIVSGTANQTALAAALADDNAATAFNAFGDGANTNPATLAELTGPDRADTLSSLKSLTLGASGPTVALPAGDALASVGAEYRIQSFDASEEEPDPSQNTRAHLSRRTSSVFGELHVPLIGEDGARRLAERLDLSLGARDEHYSDVGNALVPKFGLAWSLSRDLRFRGTWTRSFRPPNLPDLVARNSYSTLLALSDPSSASGVTTVLARYGTNPDLLPERARSWTLGSDVTPASLPGLSLSLTYFDINYTDRITDQEISPDVLTQPQYSWLVNRNVTAAELADACNHSVFQGPPGACLSTPVGAILDNRLQNVATLHTRGLDVIGKYGVDSALGRFGLGVNGTYLLEYSQANAPDSPLIHLVNTANNPLNLRLRGTASWSRRGLSATAFVNYANGYRDTLSVPSRAINSWTTVDLQLSYESPGSAGWLGAMLFALTVQNVANTLPPFVNNPVGVGYDQENADLYGRFVSFDIRKRF